MSHVGIRHTPLDDLACRICGIVMEKEPGVGKNNFLFICLFEIDRSVPEIVISVVDLLAPWCCWIPHLLPIMYYRYGNTTLDVNIFYKFERSSTWLMF
jgi:hypothetical protein